MIRYMSKRLQITENCDVALTEDEKDHALTVVDQSVSEIISPDLEEAIIRYAQRIKEGYVNEMKYWKMVNTPKSYSFPSYVKFAPTIIKRMKAEIPNLQVDGEFKRIFWLLAKYFTGSKEFEQNYGYSLDKGIMIQGPVGCGKTSLLRSFTMNPKRSYIFLSCRKVTYEFATSGFPTIEKYSSIERRSEDPYGKTEYAVAFDDLGTDEERKHYGDKVNVVADILLNRYDHLPKGYTHITTNLSTEQIEDIYGSRVKSRMREMFNQINFSPQSPDRRK